MIDAEPCWSCGLVLAVASEGCPNNAHIRPDVKPSHAVSLPIPEYRLHRCANPPCFRKVKEGVEFCCDGCRRAHEAPFSCGRVGCDCLGDRGEGRRTVNAHCGAGNLVESLRAGRVVECTLPAGHPVWTLHANGYSYNHGDVDADVWWNDVMPPPGVDRQEWLNGDLRDPSQTSTGVDALPDASLVESSAQESS